MLRIGLLFMSLTLFFSIRVSANVEIYLTTPDGQNLLRAQPPIDFSPYPINSSSYDRAGPSLIQINPDVRYQQIEGFGASLTDSSAWLIQNRLSKVNQEILMHKLFDSHDGIGINFLRQPIGGSDFALQYYSYDDTAQPDPTLEHFSIDHDKPYILPLLRQALQINSNLKIMATPWSPPAWMKQNASPRGGRLTGVSVYPAFAKYLAKFIEAYQQEGVPIYAITVQNEPLYEARYASMLMDWKEQFDLIDQYLAPQLEQSQLKTKILIFDHNWDLASYPTQLLEYQNSAILPYIAGVAFHCYGGSPEAMTQLHQAYPQLEIYLTECSDFMPTEIQQAESDISWFAHNLLIGSLRNWSKTIVRWNIALDENFGPSVPETNCPNCLGLVEINSKTGKIKYLRDYYAMGHASKFVQPGAYRIDSTHEEGGMETVAFLNPDGSHILLAYNASQKTSSFQVTDKQHVFKYELLPGSLATFKW